MKITPKNYPEKFEVTSCTNWDRETGGNIITSHGKLNFDTHKAFGGKSSGYCPDELFLVSICGCFITTTVSFLSKFDDIKIEDFTVSAKLSLVFEPSGYKISMIKMDAVISIQNQDDKQTAMRILELGEQYCHLLHFIKQSTNLIVKKSVICDPPKF